LKIRRIAVVSDGGLLKHIPAVAKHFVAAEIRPFGWDEKAKALTWLESAQ
jgi:hypothetical protein